MSLSRFCESCTRAANRVPGVADRIFRAADRIFGRASVRILTTDRFPRRAIRILRVAECESGAADHVFRGANRVLSLFDRVSRPANRVSGVADRSRGSRDRETRLRDPIAPLQIQAAGPQIQKSVLRIPYTDSESHPLAFERHFLARQTRTPVRDTRLRSAKRILQSANHQPTTRKSSRCHAGARNALRTTSSTRPSAAHGR